MTDTTDGGVEVDIRAPTQEARTAKTPVKDKDGDIEVVHAEPVAPKIIEPAEGIEMLKKNLEIEKNARIDAENRARQSEVQVTTARAETQNSQLQHVGSAIETVKQSNEALKAKYREARANNDFEAEMEVQTQLSTNAARLLQLENGKRALENQLKQPVRTTQHIDAVEQLASTLSPRSAAWVRAHPDYARNERLKRAMLGADAQAIEAGHPADSDSYFEAVEKVLGLQKKVVYESATAAAAQIVQQRSSPAAAPVSRSGTADGSRPNTVRLSADERDIAASIGMSEIDYAKNKLALQKEGLLK